MAASDPCSGATVVNVTFLGLMPSRASVAKFCAAPMAIGVVVVRTYCIGDRMRPASQSPVCRMPTTGSKAIPRMPYSRLE